MLKWAQVQLRYAALERCIYSQRDPGARGPALRAAYLDLAAACIRMAAELPAPEFEPRFDPSQRQRQAAYTAALG